MSDILVPILEAVVAFLAIAVYGTEQNPRHPILRNTVRLIAFGGAPISGAIVLGVVNNIEFPLLVTFVWAVCSLIVLSGEYYIGSKKIAYVAIAVAVIWLITVIVGLFFL